MRKRLRKKRRLERSTSSSREVAASGGMASSLAIVALASGKHRAMLANWLGRHTAATEVIIGPLYDAWHRRPALTPGAATVGLAT
jgi:hypothetical protein